VGTAPSRPFSLAPRSSAFSRPRSIPTIATDAAASVQGPRRRTDGARGALGTSRGSCCGRMEACSGTGAVVQPRPDGAGWQIFASTFHADGAP
jgi:hypothetical protein